MRLLILHLAFPCNTSKIIPNCHLYIVGFLIHNNNKLLLLITIIICCSNPFSAKEKTGLSELRYFICLSVGFTKPFKNIQ